MSVDNLTDRPFADGIYFDLDDRLYHADPALGSGDHRSLAIAPEAYWFGSVHNPARAERKDTEAMQLGRGVHKAALEGMERFKNAFVRRPERVEVSRMTDSMKALYAPRGQTILDGPAYDRAALAAQQIRSHPDLVNSLSHGEPEVSIFWTVAVDGFPVRCKARIDYLKSRALIDIKSAAVKRPMPFKIIALRNIKSFRLTIQAAHYLEARSHVARFNRGLRTSHQMRLAGAGNETE